MRRGSECHNAPWERPPGRDALWERPPGRDALWERPPGRDALWERPPGRDAPWERPPGRDALWERPPGRDAPWERPPGRDAPWERPPGRDALWERPPGRDAPWERPPGRDQARASLRAATLALLILTTACAGDAGIEATTVLSYNQCRGLAQGVTEVSYARIAAIRGGRLLQMTPGASPGADTEQSSAGDTPPATAASGAGDQDALLLAISRGTQPTPGYSLTLDGAHRRDRTAVVSVQWHVPAPGAVLAQMVTDPCLVVALPRADFQRVEAVDQNGELIGRLAL